MNRRRLDGMEMQEPMRLRPVKWDVDISSPPRAGV
jgi:hypothetical protein